MYNKNDDSSTSTKNSPMQSVEFLQHVFPLNGPDDPRATDVIRFIVVGPNQPWPGVHHFRTRGEVHALDEQGISALGFNTHGMDVYFTPHGFTRAYSRVTKADAVDLVDVAWVECDDDDIPPETFTPLPTFAVETSPGRHHLYWLLDSPVSSSEIERINYGLTYGNELHKDKGGWGLTKLLRLPGSTSYKREHSTEVKLVGCHLDRVYSPADFQRLRDVPSRLAEKDQAPLPNAESLRAPADILAGFPLDSRSLSRIAELAQDRSGALWSIYNACRRAGMPAEDCYALVKGTPNDKFTPLRLWNDILNAYNSDEAPSTHFKLTDIGNAERLAEQHGSGLRYCAERKCWFFWNSRFWEEDVTGHVHRCAFETVRSIPDEARDIADSTKRAAILKHAINSESGSRVEQMVRLAQKLEAFSIKAEAFDRSIWLLNTPSGTVDLRTGVVSPHNRADFITRITNAAYVPGAKSDEFEKFLISATEGIDVADGEAASSPEERLRAAELREFLQRLAGISATGDASEEYAPLIHGPEGSGKSTLISAITSTLGDYAKTTDFDTFLKRPHAGGIRTDLVRLNRAHMVVSVEVEDGRELAAGLFKRVTGGDEQTARGLYMNEITIQPTATFWLVANHAPRVDSTDGAIWRRILRIPFPHTVPKEKRQPGLKKLLTDPESCGPAVLAWIVEGALAWQREGLRIPNAVDVATDELRRDMDYTSEFFEDRCDFAKDATVSVEELHTCYLSWCTGRGIKSPLDRKRFGKQLADLHGCMRARGTGGQRCWQGVRLRRGRLSLVDRVLDIGEANAAA